MTKAKAIKKASTATSPNLGISPSTLKQIRSGLKKENLKFAKNYQGERSSRQPTHTVYGGAQIFSSLVSKKMGESAVKHFNEFVPNEAALLTMLNLPTSEAETLSLVYKRVLEKLKTEAVEDFRIDFEDGYGNRSNEEEDMHAQSSALEVAKGMEEKNLPPFIGIRIKPFNEERADRSLRTLNIFLSTLAKKTRGQLPNNFVVTLPKVQTLSQAVVFEKTLATLEKALKLKKNSLEGELMVETPQSILDFKGGSPIRSFVEALKGRCRSAHFGTYDYTAGCNITANYQTMMNPVCDFAKHILQVSLAGTPIQLSDGATNIMPVAIHRGEQLTLSQKNENQIAVQSAWQLSYKHIMHSLETGYYQGWDLHPDQLPIRFITTYYFFLKSHQQAANRLSAFIEKAARATLHGDVFDDAATGQGLLNFFLRGMSCGAISIEEALKTGLSKEDFDTRSFLKILERQKKANCKYLI